MTLQNRVLPDGKIVSEPWRGDFMGNRGGRIHNSETRSLLSRRWASKRWICCVTRFKSRQRAVMGKGYTELFFLDEVSALTSGHRPCFECRRADALAFAGAWREAHNLEECPKADAMDEVLHRQRLEGRVTIDPAELANLPCGTMFQCNNTTYAKHSFGLFRWTGEGYVPCTAPSESLTVLTPAAVVAVLEAGYQPTWHSSAGG